MSKKGAVRIPSVLLIDASAEACQIYQSLLEKLSVRIVDWCNSGTGWIQVWQRHRPSIVIVDVQLPKRDGMYVIEKLRALDPESCILFTHSYQGLLANQVEIQALSLGARATLQKPIVNSRFLVSIERFMHQIQSLNKT